MDGGYDRLTDKEKQTLRLLLVGYDAKSLARHFGLSVHTINERLRDSRRKLSVSSSKEAARLLHDIERVDTQTLGHMPFGDAAAPVDDQELQQPGPVAPRRHRTVLAIGGLTMISMLAALLAMSTPISASFQAPIAASSSPATETAVTGVARAWLALIDEGRWRDSWAATSRSFRSLNTVQTWQAASEQARAPLGSVLSRTLESEQDTPAPPNGYKTIRFRTDFVNRSGAVETVSLDREDGDWKVVGVYIE